MFGWLITFDRLWYAPNHPRNHDVYICFSSRYITGHQWHHIGLIFVYSYFYNVNWIMSIQLAQFHWDIFAKDQVTKAPFGLFVPEILFGAKKNCQILWITFILKWCHRSIAAVRPAKYQRDIQQVINVLIIVLNRGNNRPEEIDLVTPQLIDYSISFCYLVYNLQCASDWFGKLGRMKLNISTGFFLSTVYHKSKFK